MANDKEIVIMFCESCRHERAEIATTPDFTIQAVKAFCGKCKETTRFQPKSNKAEKLQKLAIDQTTLFKVEPKSADEENDALRKVIAREEAEAEKAKKAAAKLKAAEDEAAAAQSDEDLT